ncbi:MAG TPA: DUF6390 family protein [Actinomycetota bacterium]
MTLSGSLLFARYAFPPNALGYCGPDASPVMAEHLAQGHADPGLEGLARGFEGAWPYLRLIAESNGIGDPLEDRVVEAYWVGGPLLDRVRAGALGRFLEETFRSRAGTSWRVLEGLAGAGGVPHHNLHVFGVYPWLGLLRMGHEAEPMRVLEACRTRWARVLAVEPGRALVRSRTLAWDGHALAFGHPTVSWAATEAGGREVAPRLAPGDLVSVHWDRVCDRLTRRGARTLHRETLRALAAAQRSSVGPAAVLS